MSDQSDPSDQATKAEEQFKADALKRQAAKSRLPAGDWRKLSAKWCEGPRCGERIPDERRRAVPGVRFCVACQNVLEKRATRGNAI